MPLILRTIEFDIFNEGMTKAKILEPGEATRWETIPAGAEGSPSLAFEPEVSICEAMLGLCGPSDAKCGKNWGQLWSMLVLKVL